MQIKHGLWILVADGEKALFLRNHGDPDLPDLRIARVEEHHAPPNHEQVTDDEGRRADGGPNQRSAMERTDYKRIEKAHFAREIAGMLERALRRKDYAHLAVIAPARVLGMLRDELRQEVRAAVVAEIDKDYTHQPTQTLEKHVVDALNAA